MKEVQLQYLKEEQLLQCLIEETMSLDALFALLRISRKQRYLYYTKRVIQVNAEPVTTSIPLHKYDVVTINVMQKEELFPSWNKEIEICYEDELLLIVNKPAGMLVHSDGANTTHTLHNCVQHYYKKHRIDAPVRALHRLDVETSGLVIYCKLPFLLPYLDALLEEKKIERIYLAWIEGILKEEQVIEASIGRDRHNAKKMRIASHGAYAKTTVFPLDQRKNATLVECHLATGRTHQIRVHLQSLHHPILSDPLYGHLDHRIARCALHAWKVRCYHPLRDEEIEIVCPLPQDMESL